MAATRFYLTNSAPPVTPTSFNSGWESSNLGQQKALSTSKSGANVTMGLAELTATVGFDVMLYQGVSAGFERAGTLPAQTATFTVARLESDAAADFTSRFVIRVVSADGTTERGSGGAFVNATEWPTAVTAIGMTATTSAITVHKGDRLVIEYGFKTGNAVTTSYTGTMYYGGTASTDLANADVTTNATTRSPWLDIDTSDLFTPVATFMDATVAGYFAVEAAWGADLAAAESTWVWSDITGDVRMDDAIAIRIGKANESSKAQPAELRVTLDNRAGAYSLGGQAANWPYVRQNTPVRVRVDPDGAGWFTRFVGGAVSWQPSWDITGNEATVNLTAAGVLRRIAQHNAPVLSAMHRNFLDDADVVAYWPCEETGETGGFASAIEGHPPMAISGVEEYPYPKFASDDTFACSADLPEINLTTWRGSVPSYTSTGNVDVRWLMKAPNDGINGVQATIISIHTAGGSINRWDVDYVFADAGDIKLYSVNAAGTRTELVYTQFAVDATSRWWQFWAAQQGADILWTIANMPLNQLATGGNSGTIVTSTLGRVTAITVCPNSNISDTVLGHVVVRKSVGNLTSEYAPLNAYIGETTQDRVERLCEENELAYTQVGAASSDTLRMGRQSVAPLSDLLEEAETAGLGVIYDGPRAGVSHLLGIDKINQSVTLTLDASLGQLGGPIEPVGDDQRVTNKVTVTRKDNSFKAVAADQDSIDDIGVADSSYTASVESDLAAADHAGWALHSGLTASDTYRYPTAKIALHRNPELVTTWLATDLGDRVDLTNISSVVSQHAPGTVACLLEGYSERIDQFRWDVQLNLSPYDVWQVGRYAADTSDTTAFLARLETDGSTLNSAALAGATSLSVATASGPLWTTTADDCPLIVDVGGIPVTVTAISGASSPQTFTVTGATVTRALPAGLSVAMHNPPVLGV